jgi:hypothetical protein
VQGGSWKRDLMMACRDEERQGWRVVERGVDRRIIDGSSISIWCI